MFRTHINRALHVVSAAFKWTRKLPGRAMDKVLGPDFRLRFTAHRIEGQLHAAPVGSRLDIMIPEFAPPIEIIPRPEARPAIVIRDLRVPISQTKIWRSISSRVFEYFHKDTERTQTLLRHLEAVDERCRGVNLHKVCERLASAEPQMIAGGVAMVEALFWASAAGERIVRIETDITKPDAKRNGVTDVDITLRYPNSERCVLVEVKNDNKGSFADILEQTFGFRKPNGGLIDVICAADNRSYHFPPLTVDAQKMKEIKNAEQIEWRVSDPGKFLQAGVIEKVEVKVDGKIERKVESITLRRFILRLFVKCRDPHFVIADPKGLDPITWRELLPFLQKLGAKINSLPSEDRKRVWDMRITIKDLQGGG